MLISAAVGAVLWFGTPWQIVVTLVLWWFFGFGMWQSVTPKLQHLLEPTERTPPQLTVASAIFAIIVFFAAQAIALAILAQTLPDDLSSAVLISYLIGGVASFIFCAIRSNLQRVPFPPVLDSPPQLTGGRATLGATAIWTLVCIAAGALWLTLLRHVPPLRDIYQSALDASPIRFEPGNLSIVLLAVAAAPVVEEIVFRRFVFRIMQGAWSNRFAIFANALLFAIVHPSLSFPPVFLLGVGTAWLFARTARLWPSMLLHALYNAAVVAMS
jgi:membrane protease YdiL (CAAX protease family)